MKPPSGPPVYRPSAKETQLKSAGTPGMPQGPMPPVYRPNVAPSSLKLGVKSPAGTVSNAGGIQSKPRVQYQNLIGKSGSVALTIATGVNTASGHLQIAGVDTPTRNGQSDWGGSIPQWITDIANRPGWGNFRPHARKRDAEILVLLKLEDDIAGMGGAVAGGHLYIRSTLAPCKFCKKCIHEFCTYYGLLKHVSHG